MGRRVGPEMLRSPSTGSVRATLLLVPMALALAGAPEAASAASLNESNGETAQAKDRLLLQAEEMLFDKDKNTVEARGKVQIYYQGRALQADFAP